MIKTICFISYSSEYPYLNELIKTDLMSNLNVEVITLNKPTLNRRLSSIMVNLISAFEQKTSSIIKPLQKNPIHSTSFNTNTFHDTLFISLAPFRISHANSNGNQTLTLKANKKMNCSVESLVWHNEGKEIVLESNLNGGSPILTYHTSNNGPLVTQRIKNLNGVFYDLLYYSIKKVLQQ